LLKYAKINERIRIETNAGNFGLTKSLNKGLRFARGEYIAHMDANDISLPHRFQKQVEFMNYYLGIDLCGSWLEIYETKMADIPFRWLVPK
jgi:glycosyltransferase involved in cell wall biosynthesis